MGNFSDGLLKFPLGVMMLIKFEIEGFWCNLGLILNSFELVVDYPLQHENYNKILSFNKYDQPP